MNDPVRITVICAALSVVVVLGFQLAAVAYDRWQARKLERYDADLASRADTILERHYLTSYESVRRAALLEAWIAENEVKP